MNRAKLFLNRDPYPISQSQRPDAPKRAMLHCDICSSDDVRLVSGGKYRCLTCGYLPS
jgi:hypothetical protein